MPGDILVSTVLVFLDFDDLAALSFLFSSPLLVVMRFWRLFWVRLGR